MRAFRFVRLAALAVAIGSPGAFFGSTVAASDVTAPVPHHEHVALYENCVANLMKQATPKPERPDQVLFVKALCMCQSGKFAKNHLYAELIERAKPGGDIEVYARTYMDQCVAEVKQQMNLK